MLEDGEGDSKEV